MFPRELQLIEKTPPLNEYAVGILLNSSSKSQDMA